MTETPQQPLALVIDDQEDILQIVMLTLQHEGWRVQTAHHGREGLEAVRRETPDLILADLMMPQMTGIEFCHKLAEELKLDVPVLMISGVNENAKILNDFWELPLHHHNFLHKPFSVEELLGAVRTILPRHLAQQMAPAKPQPAPARPAAPAAPKPGVTAPPATARTMVPFKPEAGRGYRILIIDDEPDIRTVIKAALGMFHTVAAAENGMEGIELADHFGPDIIISDINMPVMNGLETAEAIRKHPAYRGVPIFFLTGETDPDLPRQAYDVGCNLFLRKPLDPIQLLKCIDRFLVETGLQPGQLHKLGRPETMLADPDVVVKASAQQAQAPQRPSAPPQAPAPQAAPRRPAAPAPVPAPAGPPANVRVLVIEPDQAQHGRFQKLFGSGPGAVRVVGGPFDLIFAEEFSQAMGNLPRWEPDLILYNPRTPRGLDGVAFGQMVRLAKLTKAPEIVFAGKEFYESEIEYSRANFRRGMLKNDASDQEAARLLSDAVTLARRSPTPKRTPFAQIAAEEAERRRVKNQVDAREARQREDLRHRYASIQNFIDKQMF